MQHSENEREDLSSHSDGREQGSRYQNLRISRLEERARCEGNRRALLPTRLFQTEQKLAEQTAELQRARIPGHCGGHSRCLFGSTNRSRFGSLNLTR